MVYSNVDFSDDLDIFTLVFQIDTDNDISKSVGKVHLSASWKMWGFFESPRVMERHPISSSTADRERSIEAEQQISYGKEW